MLSGELRVAYSNSGGKRNGDLCGRVKYQPLLLALPPERNCNRCSSKALPNEGRRRPRKESGPSSSPRPRGTRATRSHSRSLSPTRWTTDATLFCEVEGWDVLIRSLT